MLNAVHSHGDEGRHGRSFTYGLGLAGDLAGLAIVGLILFLASVAGWQRGSVAGWQRGSLAAWKVGNR